MSGKGESPAAPGGERSAGAARTAGAPARPITPAGADRALATPPVVAPGVFRVPLSRPVAPGTFRPPLGSPARPRSLLLPRGGLRPLGGQRHAPCFRDGSLPCMPVCTYRVQGGSGADGCPALAPQGCLHPATARRPQSTPTPPPACGPAQGVLPRVIVRHPLHRRP